MQILPGLYLSKHLFLPENIGHVIGLGVVRAAIEQVLGPRTPLQLGELIAGPYSVLVYLTPLFGGLLADRVLGRTRTIGCRASTLRQHGHDAAVIGVLALVGPLPHGTGRAHQNRAGLGDRRRRTRTDGDRRPHRRDFWLLHAALVASAGGLLGLVRLAWGRLLAPAAILGRETARQGVRSEAA